MGLSGVGLTRYSYASRGRLERMTHGNLLCRRREDAGYSYHGDALGSRSAITNADEDVNSTYKYYAFWEVLAPTGTPPSGPHCEVKGVL